MSRRLLGVAVAVALLAGCTTETVPEQTPATPEPTTASPSEPAVSPSESEPTPEPTAAPLPDSLSAAAVATGLAAPWSIVFHGETPIISERDSARILEYAADGAVREITVIESASARGEGGLLGITVHDDYLYAFLTTTNDNRILRYPISGDPGSLSLGAAEEILTGIPAASYHNGGRIAFGPDGMLYATTGDAGNVDASQNLDSLAGKILRLTPDGGVPGDNPFEGSLVYSYGHRNPQGIGWEPDGTMYASEFGQDTWDELNVIEAGGNYGWPIVEGIGGGGEFIDPVQQWATDDASPSGIAVTDSAIYIANLRGERLRAVPLADLADSREYFVGEFGRIRDAVLTPQGALWILTNNTDGRGNPAPDDDRILAIDLGGED